MQAQFSATLTSGDVKRHIPHTVVVPEACSRLTVRFHYTPRVAGGITNLLTLTIFDPQGFRGAGHRGGDTHEVELTPTTATRGYLIGALPAGEWTVQVDTTWCCPIHRFIIPWRWQPKPMPRWQPRRHRAPYLISHGC